MRKLNIFLLSRLIGLITAAYFICLTGFANNTPELIYSERFAQLSIPTGWKHTDNLSIQVHPWQVTQIGSEFAMQSPSGSLALDSWIFSSALKLYPGTDYTIKFSIKGSALESLRLVLNSNQSKPGATEFTPILSLINSDWKQAIYTFRVPREGLYYFGFGIISNLLPTGILIDNITVTAPGVENYYNKKDNLQSITSLNSWGANPDGSGREPLSFSAPNKKFHLTNYPANSTVILPQNWNVDGPESEIIIGNGIDPVKFETSDTKGIRNSRIGLAKNATLKVNTTQLPKFGTLDPASTVIFGKNAPAEINALETEFGMVVFEGKNGNVSNKLANQVKVKGKIKVLAGAKFELTEKLNLFDNDLELDSGATIENGSASRYVVLNGKGRVRKALKAGEEIFLPLGHKSAEGTSTYNPVKIKLASMATPDVFSVGIIDGVYSSYDENDTPEISKPLASRTVNKTWIVSEDVKGGSDITLTLTWTKEETSSGFDPDNTYISHYEQDKGWDFHTPVKASTEVVTNSDNTTTTYYSISRSGITSFSPYTGASPEVLPVELLDFSAKSGNSNTVELSWATASEQDNDYFSVERSTDGKTFMEIGQVKGAGTSSVRQKYKFTDNSPLAGTAYYRLRQVDYDGKFEYSPIRVVSLKKNPALIINIYPNPSQGGGINLQVQGLNQDEKAQLVISDMTGRSLLTQYFETEIPSALQTESLKPGTYLVTVNTKSRSHTQKLIIL